MKVIAYIKTEKKYEMLNACLALPSFSFQLMSNKQFFSSFFFWPIEVSFLQIMLATFLWPSYWAKTHKTHTGKVKTQQQARGQKSKEV